MKYTVNGKDYNTDSPVNQKILAKVVDNNIKCCVNDMVEYILKTALLCSHRDADPPFTDGDVENLYKYKCTECGETLECSDDEKIIICPNCNTQFDDIYDCGVEYTEVCQWFIVNKRFAEKLRKQNEVIIETPNNYIWGRQTFGQEIFLDGVISQIALDMEILEGQRYSWENDMKRFCKENVFVIKDI